MAEVFSTILDLSVLVFSVSSMLSVGFSYTLREIVEPLRGLRCVLLVLAGNFVLAPLLAYAVARLLSLDPVAEMGLILMATAAGASFLIKLTQIAGRRYRLRVRRAGVAPGGHHPTTSRSWCRSARAG